MKNASGKSPVLASHPGAHQTDGQIGILVSPADKAVIETVDAIEIAPRHREVAGLGAAPTLLLDVDPATALVWAQMRVHLAEAGRRANVNDLWIAACAASRGLPVVTQDDDFAPVQGIAGLVVIRV